MLDRLIHKSTPLLIVLMLCSAGRSFAENVGKMKVSEEAPKTIAHRLLELESKAQPSDDSQLRLLNQLLATMVARLPKARTDLNAALVVLRTVDVTLVENNFVLGQHGSSLATVYFQRQVSVGGTQCGRSLEELCRRRR